MRHHASNNSSATAVRTIFSWVGIGAVVALSAWVLVSGPRARTEFATVLTSGLLVLAAAVIIFTVPGLIFIAIRALSHRGGRQTGS